MQSLMMFHALLEYSKDMWRQVWVAKCHNIIAVLKKPKWMQIYVQKLEIDSSVDHFGSVTESSQTTKDGTAPEY